MTTEIATLVDVSRHHAQAFPDRVAFSFEGRNTSFATFDRHSDQVANGLIAEGIGRDGRIAYLGKNSDCFFELLLGAAKAGAVLVPVNWRLALPEIQYIMADSDAEILFVGREFTDLVGQLLPQLPNVRTIIAVEGNGGQWADFATWRDRQAWDAPDHRIEASSVVLQLYTSGTTGKPKGAMLHHQGLLALKGDPAQMADWQRWTADDIGLVAMPLFHVGGAGMGLLCFLNGAKGIIDREFDPLRALDFVERDRITKLFLVPAAMQIIVRHPRAREIDFSCIKYILYGAAPIPLELLRECITVFRCGFVQAYGMTETCGMIVALPPEDHALEGSDRMRSAGRPLPGVDIRILDENGAPLPSGEGGEIATRSVMNMTGYWKLPEATAQAISTDGWLRTGDAGYVDAAGYLYILDRVKDVIISGGENIYPAEVENAIFGHPDVADVAVIGVPDDKWGEAVKAVIVLKPGSCPARDDIIGYARERIAAYKAPKSIDFIDALPRNPSGKVLRRELRAPYWAGRERSVN